MLGVNLTAPFLLTRAALPHMLAAFHALLRNCRAHGGMDDVLVPG